MLPAGGPYTMKVSERLAGLAMRYGGVSSPETADLQPATSAPDFDVR
jgi:hypothetical protein